MPAVGKKKFAYTPTGVAKAKAYAKKTGKNIVRAKKGKVVSPKGKKCVFGIALVSGKKK